MNPTTTRHTTGRQDFPVNGDDAASRSAKRRLKPAMDWASPRQPRTMFARLATPVSFFSTFRRLGIRTLGLGACILWAIIVLVYLNTLSSGHPHDTSSLPVPRAREIGIAFVVQVTSSNWLMLEQLMGAIYHPGNIYLIHCDAGIAKADMKHATGSIEQFLDRDNVHLADHRDVITWGGVSVVLNLLAGIATILEIPANWTHLIFIAPSNYPLVSPQDMREMLAEHRDETFALFRQYEELLEEEKQVRSTHNAGYILDPAVLQKPGPQEQVKPFKDWQALEPQSLLKGELWQILSKSDCHHLTVSPSARKTLLQLNGFPATDELYFTNVLYQNEIRKASHEVGFRAGTRSLRNDHLHHIVWWHPEIENPGFLHPLLLNSTDLFYSDLKQSGALFARKFDMSAGSQALVGEIDENIIGNPNFVNSVRRRLERACFESDLRCK